MEVAPVSETLHEGFVSEAVTPCPGPLSSLTAWVVSEERALLKFPSAAPLRPLALQGRLWGQCFPGSHAVSLGLLKGTSERRVQAALGSLC